MLKVENISAGYGKNQVLYDVSFEVKEGEVVLLTGGNGSGKSTALKCIYNLLPIWNGSIWFENERIDDLKPSDLIRKGLVYIPQKDFCFENLTVDENLRIAGNVYKKKELEERLDLVYKQTELAKLKKRKPFNLSGGEKKLLAFGMGMVHKPKLILFDEPLAGMDAQNSQLLLIIFDKYFKNNSAGIVIVEHKNATRNLYSRKIVMELGNIKN
jgi:branched-chain amino acid transport system ATP-binding protein